MPLKAVDIKTKQVVYSFNFPNKLALLDKHPPGNLHCSITNAEVFPRGGKPGLILHFVRKKNFFDSCIDYHPESYEHNLLKLKTFSLLQQEIQCNSNTNGWKVEIEYKLPNIGKNGRIADVAVISSSGHCVYVCECQLAAITEQEIEQRTNDYEESGIDCMWILGGRANNSQNQRWCYQRLGVVYTANFQNKQFENINFL